MITDLQILRPLTREIRIFIEQTERFLWCSHFRMAEALSAVPPSLSGHRVCLAAASVVRQMERHGQPSAEDTRVLTDALRFAGAAVPNRKRRNFHPALGAFTLPATRWSVETNVSFRGNEVVTTPTHRDTHDWDDADFFS